MGRVDIMRFRALARLSTSSHTTNMYKCKCRDIVVKRYCYYGNDVHPPSTTYSRSAHIYSSNSSYIISKAMRNPPKPTPADAMVRRSPADALLVALAAEVEPEAAFVA